MAQWGKTARRQAAMMDKDTEYNFVAVFPIFSENTPNSLLNRLRNRGVFDGIKMDLAGITNKVHCYLILFFA